MRKDIIWAPWRMGYILGKKKKGCIFCSIGKGKNDEKNFVVGRGDFSFVVLNIFPYNNGHLMIAPYRHIKNLESLKEEEGIEILKLLRLSIRILKKILKPEGFNVGINIGKVSGAGVEGHLHIHIVPRWEGDTNFMPVISETKVIPQSLKELYKILREEFEKCI